MWRYTNIPGNVEDVGKKEKRSSLSHLCLEGLLRIFTACQQRYPDRMAQLLSTMGQTQILFKLAMWWLSGFAPERLRIYSHFVFLTDISDDNDEEDDGTEMKVFYIRQFQVRPERMHLVKFIRIFLNVEMQTVPGR